MGVSGIRVTCFYLLGCLIDGWGFVIWPNVELLHTCILFLCMCTAKRTGHLTWGMVF